MTTLSQSILSTMRKRKTLTPIHLVLIVLIGASFIVLYSSLLRSPDGASTQIEGNKGSLILRIEGEYRLFRDNSEYVTVVVPKDENLDEMMITITSHGVQDYELESSLYSFLGAIGAPQKGKLYKHRIITNDDILSIQIRSNE